MRSGSRQALLDAILNKEQIINTHAAKVISVKGNTCTVVLYGDGLEIDGVKLLSDDDAKEGVLLRPKKDSWVLIGCIDNEISKSFVCQYSELESGLIKVGGSSIGFDKDVIDFKKGNSSVSLKSDSIDIVQGYTVLKVDSDSASIKTPNSLVKVGNSGVSLQYGLLLPEGKIKIDLSANGSIMVDDKTLFAFDKDAFGMGKENSSVSFGDNVVTVEGNEQVILKQGALSVEMAGERVNIENASVSLKSLFDDLADIILTLKVITPTGSSTVLFPDSAAKVAAFKAKYPQLLS